MGKYHRKSNRGSYSKEKLREAVREVECGRMSGYSASKTFQIPRMTIMDHVNKRRTKSTTLGRNTALSPEIEYKLATNLHVMEKYGFGLSRKEVLQMVGDYVNKNDLITPFKNGIPGKDWFLAFKERHGLSMKKPQAVEYARKRAMDPFIIYPYFDLLEKTISDLNLKNKPSAIWNLDETSFSKDPAKTKIIGAKGHAATRVISSPGRDNTTVLLGASASGEKTPPLIVYKGKNVWDTWTSSEAYPGTSYAATKNGWMEAEVFEAFFKKTFLPAVQGQRPVLLIYDGHSTHVGLNIIEEARKENITIMKLPPHTSHILQPLDIAVMKSFKDRWDPLLVRWQRLNVGRVMPKSEFAKLIGQVWAEIDPQVLRNGFRKAGIFPVNSEEINENQFDSLKLRHWREQESLVNIAKKEETIKRNPKTLLTLVLDFFNHIQTHENIEGAVIINNRIESLEYHTRDQIISFEDLLLQKVKRGDSSPKPQRRKVAPGAEVITHGDVLEKKREEQRKNTNKNLRKGKDSQLQSIPKITDDVVYLKNVSKNDCQMRPFTAKNVSNLPPCLQKRKPNSEKIKIISNVVVKQANTEEKAKVFSTRNQKYYKIDKHAIAEKENKHVKSAKKHKDIKALNIRLQQHKKVKQSSTRKDQVFDSENNYEKSKPGPSGLCKTRIKRRSSSTTSVSGSISSHSDSDLMDAVSDSTINNGEDNSSYSLQQNFNIIQDIDVANDFNPDIICHANKEHQVATYYAGDDDLVNTSNSLPPTFNIVEEIDVAIDFTPDLDHVNQEHQFATHHAEDDDLVNISNSLPQTFNIVEEIDPAIDFMPDVDHVNQDHQVATNYAGDDDLLNTSNSLPQTFNVVEEIDPAIDFTPDVDHVNQDHQVATYYAGDDDLLNTSNSLPQTFNVVEKIDAAIDFTPDVDHVNQEYQVATYYAGDDDLLNTSNSLPQTFNVVEKIDATIDFTPDVDHVNQEYQVATYYAGDDVLVRYHVRQKWTYYVGKLKI